MRVLDRIRIRTAVFFCGTGVLPLLVISFLLCRRLSVTVQQFSTQLDLSVVSSVHAVIEERLSLFKEQAVALSWDPAIQSLDRLRQRPVCDRFLSMSSTFFKLLVLDPDGRLVNVQWNNGYRGEESQIGKKDLAQDPHVAPALARALATRSAVWTSPSVDSFSQPILYLVAPIHHFIHEERVVGFLVGALHLSGNEIQLLLDRTLGLPSYYACILDDSGQILARKGDVLPPDLAKHAFPMMVDGAPISYRPPEREMVQGRIHIHGREILATAARLKSVGLTLVVGQPLALLNAHTEDAVKDTAVMCLVALLITLAASVLLSGSFVGPVLALVEGIRRVGGGQLEARVAVIRSDELGQAATAFNDMAATLEKQQVIEQIWAERWQPRNPASAGNPDA